MSQPPSGDVPDRSGDRRSTDPADPWREPARGADGPTDRPSYPYPPGPWQAPQEGSTRPVPSGADAPPAGAPPSAAHGTGGYPPQPGYPVPPPYPPPGYPGGAGSGYTGGYTGVGSSPEQQSTRTQAVVSLVLNILSVLACANVLGIVGAILAGVALGRLDTDLPSARNLVRWSWILLVGGLVLLLLVVLVGAAVLLVGGVASRSGGF